MPRTQHRLAAALAALIIAPVAGGCSGAGYSRARAGTSGVGPATTTSAGTAGASTSAASQPTATTAAPGTGAASSSKALAGSAGPRGPSTTQAPVGAPPFAVTMSLVTAADVPSSWRPGCPLAPGQLRTLHLSYWGFDNQPHSGTMVVNAAVTGDVIQIFSILYGERFPIHQMQPVDVYGGSDPASMAANNTSGFNCRDAVAPGPPQWSVHAFGEAIDVNTVENPYVQGGIVTPPAGAGFLNRRDVRPGMAVPNGQLVQAFTAAGWFWGGRWSTPDYQHFSKTGG